MAQTYINGPGLAV